MSPRPSRTPPRPSERTAHDPGRMGRRHAGPFAILGATDDGICDLAPRLGASPDRRSCSTAALFVLPALLVYAVFVVIPIIQADLLQRVQVERAQAADRLRRARQLRARPVRPGVPRRDQPQRVLRHAVARHPDPVRARPCADAQRTIPRPGVLPADLLRAVRPLRGHHGRRLPAPAHAGLARRPALDGQRGPRGPHPAVARRPVGRAVHPVRGHLVEVLRVPHDPAARRPAGHPARARGGGRHRRRDAAGRPSATSRCRCSGRPCGSRSSCRSSAPCSCSTWSGS